MRIGICTGGGDVPGLNPCIKAVVNRVAEGGHEVVGIRRGWGGLLETDPDDQDRSPPTSVALDPGDRADDRPHGRHDPAHVAHQPGSRQGRRRARLPRRSGDRRRPVRLHRRTRSGSIEHLGLDALIPIGGDDTLSYGLRLHDEGVPVIAIPKTMDNDVHGTDYCIGFSTAVTRGVEFIHALRTSTGSHERIAVVELFGRYSGETSLITAYLAGVDRAVISEVPFDVERLAELLDRRQARATRRNYAMVTISEGATIAGGEMVLSGEADAYGHRKLGGIGAITGELISELTGEGIVLQQVAYLMRSGSPDSLDLMVATNYAVMAADLVLEGASGRMVALRGGTYTNVPISVTREGVKRVDVDELYDADQYRPKVRHVAGKPMFLY